MSQGAGSDPFDMFRQPEGIQKICREVGDQLGISWVWVSDFLLVLNFSGVFWISKFIISDDATGPTLSWVGEIAHFSFKTNSGVFWWVIPDLKLTVNALKMDGWKIKFPFGRAHVFRGELLVLGRVCFCALKLCHLEDWRLMSISLLKGRLDDLLLMEQIRGTSWHEHRLFSTELYIYI